MLSVWQVAGFKEDMHGLIESPRELWAIMMMRYAPVLALLVL